MVGTGEVFESMLTQVPDVEAVVEKSSGRFVYEYLATVAGRRDPRRKTGGRRFLDSSVDSRA